MPAVIAFLFSNWKTVVVGLAIASLAGYIELIRVERDHYRGAFEKEHAAFGAFKVKLADEAEIQKQRAEAIEAHDGLLKLEADHDHETALERLRADVERVRHERDSARSAFLSAAPAGSKCPDGQICVDRAEYLGAYRGLISEVRSAGDEGSEVTVDLNTAKLWATKRR